MGHSHHRHNHHHNLYSEIKTQQFTMSFMDRVKKVTAPAVNAGAKAMLKVGLRVLSAPELECLEVNGLFVALTATKDWKTVFRQCSEFHLSESRSFLRIGSSWTCISGGRDRKRGHNMVIRPLHSEHNFSKIQPLPARHFDTRLLSGIQSFPHNFLDSSSHTIPSAWNVFALSISIQ